MPPHDLVSLGELANQIRLGAKTRAALHVLLAHPENVAFGSITELAQQLGISPSTLTRLAKRLGFIGFAQFQRVFVNSLASQPIAFYSGQASRHLQRGAQCAELSEPDTSQRLERLVAENMANIQHSVKQLHTTQLIEAARHIAQAKRVRVHGVRQYSALAQFLVYGLSLIRSDVALLDGCGLGIAEGLAQLEPADVLISASVRPYSQEVLAVHEQAVQAQLSTISFTDHRSSPLASTADYAFLIPFQSSFFSNSISAYFVMAEGLLNQVAWELGQSALEAIQKREQLIAALNIENKR